MKKMFTPYTGTKPYIFGSYNHEDRIMDNIIMAAMNRAGYRVWYDEGIPLTADWTEKVEERIQHCEICTVFLSQEFVESRYCQMEARYAFAKSKPIFCVYLEENITLRHGLDMLLSSLQSFYVYEYKNIDRFTEDFLAELKKTPKISRFDTPHG